MSTSSGKNDQEQLKQKEALIIRLQHDLSVALQEAYWAKLQIQSLKEQLRQERIARFGARSETLTDLQLSLLDEEPSVTSDGGGGGSRTWTVAGAGSSSRSGGTEEETQASPGAAEFASTPAAKRRDYPLRR